MNLKGRLREKTPPILRRRFARLRFCLCQLLALPRNHVYDMIRFARYSAAIRGADSKERLRAQLTLTYHRIEKALVLKDPRPGFAKTWIQSDFVEPLAKYQYCYGTDDLVRTCLDVLYAWRVFNEAQQHPLPQIFAAIDRLKTAVEPTTSSPHSPTGGAVTVQREALHDVTAIDFERFVNSRHSIRDFADRPVEPLLIQQAIALAQLTPSVCNRQPWHVYAFADRDKIASALKWQHGHQGFSEQIQILLLVAADLTGFVNVAERHEGWVDAGMFSMSLIYALHSLGLGTCCLNLCLNAPQDKGLRRATNLAPYHTPVMMIAVGHLPDRLAVTCSTRRPVSDVLTWR